MKKQEVTRSEAMRQIHATARLLVKNGKTPKRDLSQPGFAYFPATNISYREAFCQAWAQFKASGVKMVASLSLAEVARRQAEEAQTREVFNFYTRLAASAGPNWTGD